MPAIRAIAHPCRCLCLGLRLQITRMTPRRVTTLQCSQMGRTLDRTFNRLSGKVQNVLAESRTIAGAGTSRKGPRDNRLRCTPQFDETPLTTYEPVAEEQRFVSQFRGSGDDVPPGQCDEPPP